MSLTNISCFPLYDDIIKNLDSFNSRLNKKNLAKSLNIIDETHRDHVYLLIKIFSLKNEKVPNLFEVPYKGVSVMHDNDVCDLTFDLANMPPKLVKILQYFCESYAKVK
jgi:hypothetical protein